MKRRLVLLAVLAGLATTLVPSISAGADGGGVDPQALERAIRFRETSSFRADETFVRETLQHTSKYDAAQFGIPLDDDEIRELERRLAIQRSLSPAKRAAATLPDTAGFYIDQSAGGRPVFLVAGDPVRHRAALEPLVDTAFEVRVVERSLAQLTELQERIVNEVENLAGDGITVTAVGVQPSLNQVVVGVADLNQEARAAISTFGPAAAARAMTEGELDACVSRYNCPPLKGGIVIRSSYNNHECTAGWMGKIHGTSTMRLLTAAHCIQVNGGIGVSWKHNGVVFGQAKNETFYFGSPGDAGLISVSVSSPRNKFYASTNTDLRGVTSSVPNSSIGEGDFVCRSGRTTGYMCGHITIPFGDRYIEGTRFHQQTSVDFDADKGDSGAPMFEDYAAYGIHTDSTEGCCTGVGWFSSIDWLKYALDVNQDVDWRLCVTTSCGF